MPFPLAHPAAVLPLRRYCPRWLSFPALVAGSVSPDAGYLFGKTGLSDMSHSLVGGMPFGIIIGWLMLGVFAMAGGLLKKLPQQYEQRLGPIFQQPIGSAAAVMVSLAIGVGTHLFLDSFTHTKGWFVMNVAVLQFPLTTAFDRIVRVCHVLWYIVSFVGVSWLVLSFRRWEDRAIRPTHAVAAKSHVVEAVLVGLLVFPIEVLHHVVRSKAGLAVVAALSLALGLGVLIRRARQRQTRANAHKCGTSCTADRRWPQEPGTS